MDLENWDPTPEFPNFYFFSCSPVYYVDIDCAREWAFAPRKKKPHEGLFPQWISKNAGNWLPFFFWVSRSPNQYGTAAGETLWIFIKKRNPGDGSTAILELQLQRRLLAFRDLVIPFPVFYLRRSRQIRERRALFSLFLFFLLLLYHFSVSHVHFFGCEKEKKCLKRSVKREKMCSSWWIDLSKILYSTPQISERVPFLFPWESVVGNVFFPPTMYTRVWGLLSWNR